MVYKALISQRQQTDKFGINIDVLESTYLDFFDELSVLLFPISNFTNNIEKYLLEIAPDFIILSGGGDVRLSKNITPKEYQQSSRDLVEDTLIDYAVKNKIPILGICRGLQQLNIFFGGKNNYLNNLLQKRPISKDHKVVFNDGVKLNVNNYHNYGVYKENLATSLNTLALDIDNDIVEAFYNIENSILALQWHPERPFKDKESLIITKQLIKKFIEEKGNVNESYYSSSRERD